MKKTLFFLIFTIYCFSVEQKEKRIEEFCDFTTEVFSILKECSQTGDAKHLEQVCIASVKRLETYEKNSCDPRLSEIIKEFIVSLQKEVHSKGCLGDAVASFGRFIKGCVDCQSLHSELSFGLNQEKVTEQLHLMETQLGTRLPKQKDINFHQLMMESLADQEYDIALYAYFKIAQMRFQKL